MTSDPSAPFNPAALLDARCFPHPVSDLRLEETHISWVVLTGDWAYKIKKPVNLGFLDFSTLDLRRHFCEEELRLNRRYAPEIYDAVVALAGPANAPVVGGAGTPLEYAVKMREFPQDARADHLLERGAVSVHDIAQLAASIAAFHESAPAAGARDSFGQPAAVLAPVEENFRQIRPALTDPQDTATLDAIEEWSRQEFARLAARFTQRRDSGRVRECHGDLHLGNIARFEGNLIPFDCIEFNPDLRWIDVMSETAFLFMDLVHRRRTDLAYWMLDRYLQVSGDYAGLDVLRFYTVYRALVRAKVRCIRIRQGAAEAPQLLVEYRDFIDIARGFMTPRQPVVVITHGPSASGKSTAAASLLKVLPAIRIRSDVERKRLHGLGPLVASGSGFGKGLYSREMHRATYDRLLELAGAIVRAGFAVIVDAAFLRRDERTAFRKLAQELHTPFLILDCDAPASVLFERIAARAKAGADPSEATIEVVKRQLAHNEPIDDSERPYCEPAPQFFDGAADWSGVLTRLHG